MRIHNTGFLASLAVAMLAGILAARCSNSSTSSKNYVQVDRLGRPAINEGLVVTNTSLNGFNGIPPTLDLSSGNLAVALLTKEMTATLTAFNAYGTGTLAVKPPSVNNVLRGFLPDVLRIDTAQNFTPAQGDYPGAYGGATNGGLNSPTDVSNPLILTGGRMLTDDAIDVTLSYLLGGFTPNFRVADGVYLCAEEHPAANAALQGHHALTTAGELQSGTQPACSSTAPLAFPFLARPD